MSYETRLRALAVILATLATVPASRVIWDALTGIADSLPQPEPGVVVLRPSLLPVSAQAAGLGSSAPTDRLSVLVVSILWPRGAALETIAPVVAELQSTLRRRRLNEQLTLEPSDLEIVDQEGPWNRGDITVPVRALTREV